ncbi:MAG: N-methylproline demethylase, partial [Alphaproteobacteria bacterium]
MGQYDALLKPLKIKNVVIRNRIMSTAHAPAYDEDGKPKERYQLYHEEKAKGGIGLTMFGGSTGVSVDSKLDWGALACDDDSIVPYFRQFSELIHRHGAALMIQITHMGRWAHWDLGSWLPPIGPSFAHERAKFQYPKAMEDWDIRRVVRDFGQAARRCKEGGLDGLEVSAHGSALFDQFWSPLHNNRTDKYGGSLENRMRFGLEVFEEMRRSVGADYVLGMRMSGDEMIERGHAPEDCLEIARRYAQSGLVDFLNVSGSQTYTYLAHARITPNMSWPVAPYLHLASAIKAAVDVPVFHATRINDLATAARAVEDGHVDMVAMTRGHMADPH